MGAICYTTVKTRASRLTRLDVCGLPVVGPKSVVVTNGFVRAANAWDVDEGTPVEQKNDWGEYCLNEPDDPVIKGGNVTLDLCNVDPDAYSIAANAPVEVATAEDDFATLGDSIGWGVNEGIAGGNFMLEAWTKLGGGACSTDGDPLWVYSWWPWIKAGRVGDQTLDRATTTFQLVGKARGAAEGLGAGPHEGIITVPAGAVFRQRITAVQPPAAVCGATELAAPEEP